MSATTSPCPSAETLNDLLANALPTERADEVRAHLAACPVCQARLTGPAVPGSTAGEPVNGTPQPARNVRPAGSTPGPTIPAVAARVTRPLPDYLAPPEGPGEIGRFGEYRVVGVLGEGGMAHVFDAEDPALGRPVALKVLKPSAGVGAGRERFLREARSIAGLPHDHIVTIYAVGEVGEIPFIALERLEGVSLEKRLQRDRWLSVAEALSVARQVAEGLTAAHEQGLVHRDIKPANVWLEGPGPDGPFRNVKILDFGVARVTLEQANITLPGQVIGTPDYMAPEQALGAPVDQRADLYSLGCVLYRMLTGHTPFASSGPDTVALLSAIIRDEPVPVAELAPQLPSPVATLINDLLAKDPDGRPASAQAVIERIRQAEGGNTILASSTAAVTAALAPPPAGAVRGRRIGWGVWAGGSVVILAAFVGLAFGLARYLDPDEKGPADKGAGQPGQPANSIKVGILHSEHGTLAMSEEPLIDAARMAVDAVNEAGGVLKRQLLPVVEDGESDSEVFARRAAKLIDEDGVAVIFGCWSSSSRKRVAEVCQKKGALLIYPTFYEGLEESPAVFYLGGSPNHVLLPAARFVLRDLSKKRIFLVGSETVFSRAAHAILQAELIAGGAAVVGEALIPLGGGDFGDVVRQASTARADIILNTLDGQGNVAFYQEARKPEVLKDVPIFWFNVSEQELRHINPPGRMAGDYTAACYFESLESPENVTFLKDYRTWAGSTTRRLNDGMQTTYAAVQLWKQAVTAAKSLDPELVRAELKKQTFAAPGGLVTIDPRTQHAWRTWRIGQFGPDRTIKIVAAGVRPEPPRPFPPSRTREEWTTFLDTVYRGWGNRWEKHAR